jgi:hypothetical protein
MNIVDKLKLLYYLNKVWSVIKGGSMKNWKTTASGVLAALGPVLLLIGVPQEVCAAITTLGIFLIGLFSKDSNVTGGTVQQ